MLKKRLVACIMLQNNMVVQSINFKNFLVVSHPKISIDYFNNWDVDEIILLDISQNRTEQYHSFGLKNHIPRADENQPGVEGQSFFDIITAASRGCFVPLTVGGGIRTIKDVRHVLKSGADKFCVNTIALERPGFLVETAEKFGRQCIVVSIDAKRENGKYKVFADNGKRDTGLEVVAWAKKVAELGAGEIFLNSIDRDGSKLGYDIELVRKVVDSVNIPVIACGGVGKMEHFVEGIEQGHASAVAAANIFQYTEHATIVAKAAMKKSGIDVRLCTEANYLNNDY